MVQLDGELRTPPVSAGLLAGVARAEALDLGQVREATIHKNDLTRAGAIWFLNSARGWIPVRL